MAIRLGPNQYGKAETHVMRVYRDTARHEIRDLTVSTSLRGDFSAAHTTGDQSDVLPTDTQKNTVFAFAKEKGIDAPEQFALELADRFLAVTPKATGARIEAVEATWNRIEVDGPSGRQGHDHAFVQGGGGTRTTVVNVDGRGDERVAYVVSGLEGLVVLKSTGSEFRGFLKDEFTTLTETDDRILATSLVARWRYDHRDGYDALDWNATFAAVKALLLERFAQIHSQALQQTLYGMGEAVLEQVAEVAEIRFSAPNKHHVLSDLTPFGLENPNEVFYAADRPFGLIEVTVERDDGPDPGSAWHAVPGFV